MNYYRLLWKELFWQWIQNGEFSHFIEDDIDVKQNDLVYVENYKNGRWYNFHGCLWWREECFCWCRHGWWDIHGERLLPPPLLKAGDCILLHHLETKFQIKCHQSTPEICLFPILPNLVSSCLVFSHNNLKVCRITNLEIQRDAEKHLAIGALWIAADFRTTILCNQLIQKNNYAVAFLLDFYSPPEATVQLINTKE